VAAELEPAVELAVVREQDRAPVGREQPDRARDVAFAAGALEAVGMAAHELPDVIDADVVFGVAGEIGFEEVEEMPAVHGGGD
jgi:hypothetical protein